MELSIKTLLPADSQLRFCRHVGQAWMREKKPRLLVIWGRYDLSFDPGEPERYRNDVPDAEVHVLDAGHFALDTAADEIAALMRKFIGS